MLNGQEDISSKHIDRQEGFHRGPAPAGSAGLAHPEVVFQQGLGSRVGRLA